MDIDTAALFECPTCGERLQSVMPGTGKVQAVIVVATIFITAVEKILSWPIALVVLLLFQYFATRFTLSFTGLPAASSDRVQETTALAFALD